jgi:N-acetylglucosamine-6-sulfatase
MERHMSRYRAHAARRPVSVAALVVGLCLGAIPGDTDARPAKPNIVLILTDDEDVGIHAFMPKTEALIEDQGTTFVNFFVTYPWCCPSRATILRGQYAHNTGVLGNEPPWGGFEKFHELGLGESTIATWLQAGGYHTAMVGKYLNRYVPEKDGVPPGWSEWYVGGNAHPSYDYTLNENGRIVAYGDRPEDYLNDVLTGKAVQVIRKASAADRPFFVYVLPYTPHSPSVAAPRHQGMFADAELPRTPAFDEVDISDKPAFIRSLPPVDEERFALLEDEYRRRLRSLQAIDDMVESIVNALEAEQVLDDTYVIYSSDNGFHLGEHRLPAGKDFPYEEDIRVPMIARGPGVPAGERIDAMALNIDLAPTLAEIAGITPPAIVDGRSLLPLFADPAHPWRRSFLVERRQFEAQYLKLDVLQGMMVDELDRSAHFDAIRTDDWTYVEYRTGERELYDLAADPYQLANLAGEADPALVAALSERLAALATCAAAECRRLENLPAGTEFRSLAKGEPGARVVPAAATN